MKKIITLLLFLLPAFVHAHEEGVMPENVIWNEISKDEAASFPFGNGVVAGNVWAEKDGVKIYLALNNSFSELGRLLKVGRLHLNINNIVWDNNTSQVLELKNGRVVIENKSVSVTVFADLKQSVIWVHGKMKEPADVTIEPEIWRSEPHNPHTDDLRSSLWSAKGFNKLPFIESADVTIPGGFYHHNDSSIVRLSAINNHIDPSVVPDPFINRTFGIMMSSKELHNVKNSGAIKSNQPLREFTVKIAVTSTQGDWDAETKEVLQSTETYNKASKQAKNYWNEFWERSYIKVSTADSVTGKKITEAYNCQRWITNIAGKSNYPIKYNGSLFTVKEINPDFRKWGECYWWQNTRLPYYSMVKTGDWDVLKHMFCFFQRMIPVFKAQAKQYHNAEGATIPETMTQFGTFAVADFGFGAAEPQTMWIRHIMQCSLDLTHLMMDYVRYSEDEKFLVETIVPMSEEFLQFFISRNKIDESGKMRIKNTQALETYWYGVENDAPTVAGLHAVVKDFKPYRHLLPESLISKLDYIEKVVPEIPIMKDAEGRDVYAPAGVFENRTNNCENPELMVIFPFKLSTCIENTEIGKNSFNNRKNRFNYGWPLDGQTAAVLGMTDIAKDQLIARINATNPKYKFPSYYGPNFDWTPDQCHGGNIMTTLQEMIMQCYDGKVYLLPAFPKDWDVSFRLAIPGKEYIKGKFYNGNWNAMTDKYSSIVYK